ncbi:hypothetical protein GCM10017708_05340 [Arthrobacter citreus]
MTTFIPAATASRATADPMFPLPMIPSVGIAYSFGSVPGLAALSRSLLYGKQPPLPSKNSLTELNGDGGPPRDAEGPPSSCLFG